MYIDEDAINDSKTFILKLISVLSDEQVRALNHNFYSDYSDIREVIKYELKKRNMSIECEFTPEGEFKY